MNKLFIVFGIFFLILFMGVAQAACVAHWSLNDTDGLKNSCNSGTYDLTNNGATSGATGMFEEAYNFSTNDYMVASGDIDLLSDFHFAVWAKPHALSGDTGIIGETPDGADQNVEFYFHFQGEYLRLYVSNAAGAQACLDDTTPIPTGSWTHVAAAMNGTKMQLYVNATMVKSCDYSGVRQNKNSNTHIGRVGSLSSQYLNSALDEFWIYDEVLNSSALTNLMNYNNLSGAGGVPAADEPYITLNSPSDSYTDNNFTAGFTPVSLAGNEFINCTLFANETESGANSTDLTNNTINYITNDTLAGEGLYTWFIQCGLTNGTMVNSQTNRTFTLDTTAPVITINNPSTDNSTEISYTSTYNADIDFSDNEALFNCSYNVYNSTFDLVHSDTVDCSGGTTYNWTTSDITDGGTLDMGVYYLNVSATDSHTAQKWKADKITRSSGKLEIEKNKKTIQYNLPVAVTPRVTQLLDRVKWEYDAVANAGGVISHTIQVVSEDTIHLIKNSKYAGHMVTGDRWLEFQDLVDMGCKVSTKQKAPTIVDVNILCTGYEAFESVTLDPAEGGINVAFEVVEFEVVPIETNIIVNDVTSPLTAQYMNKTVWAQYTTNTTGQTYNYTYDVCPTLPDGWTGAASCSGDYRYSSSFNPGGDLLLSGEVETGSFLNHTQYVTISFLYAGNGYVSTKFLDENLTTLFYIRNQVRSVAGGSSFIKVYHGNDTLITTLSTSTFVGGSELTFNMTQHNATHIKMQWSAYNYYAPVTLSGTAYIPYILTSVTSVMDFVTNPGYGTVGGYAGDYITSQEGGGAVLGATCNVTLSNFTVVSMSYDAVDGRYEGTYTEPIADSLLHPVSVTCSKENYQTATSTLNYYVDDWQPKGFGSSSFPYYTNAFMDYESLSYTGALSEVTPASVLNCAPVLLEGESLNESQNVRMLAMFSTGNASSHNMTILGNEEGVDRPDLTELYATCDVTAPDGLIQPANRTLGRVECQTTLTQDMGVNLKYWLCMQQPSGLSVIGGAGNNVYSVDMDADPATWNIYNYEIFLGLVTQSTQESWVGTEEGYFVTGIVKSAKSIDGVHPAVGSGIDIQYWERESDGSPTGIIRTVTTNAQGRYYISSSHLTAGNRVYLNVEDWQTASDGYMYYGTDTPIEVTRNLSSAIEQDIFLTRSQADLIETNMYITSTYHESGFTLNDAITSKTLSAADRIFKVSFSLFDTTTANEITDLNITAALDTTGCAFSNPVYWASYQVVREGDKYVLKSNTTAPHTSFLNLMCDADEDFTIDLTGEGYNMTFTLSFAESEMELLPHGLVFTNQAQDIDNYDSVTFLADLFNPNVQQWKTVGFVNNASCEVTLLDTDYSAVTNPISANIVDIDLTADIPIIHGDKTADHKYHARVECTANGFQNFSTITDLLSINHGLLQMRCTVNDGYPINPEDTAMRTVCEARTYSPNASYDEVSLSSLKLKYQPALDLLNLVYTGASDGWYKFEGNMPYRCGDGSQFCPTTVPIIKQVTVDTTTVPASITAKDRYDYIIRFGKVTETPITIAVGAITNIHKGKQFWSYGLIYYEGASFLQGDINAMFNVDDSYQNKIACVVGNMLTSDFNSNQRLTEQYLRNKVLSIKGTTCEIYYDSATERYGFIAGIENIGNTQFLLLDEEEQSIVTSYYTVKYGNQIHVVNSVASIYSPIGGDWVEAIDQFFGEIAKDPTQLFGRMFDEKNFFGSIIWIIFFGVVLMLLISIFKRF